MVAYPDSYASYPVPVRQFRLLPFGLLQCMGHPKPPCHLLMLQGVTLAHKGLAPSGLSSKFIMSKNLIIFTIQGTHISYPTSAAAVVFGGHLSARAAFRLDPEYSGQSAPACSFLRSYPRRHKSPGIKMNQMPIFCPHPFIHCIPKMGGLLRHYLVFPLR